MPQDSTGKPITAGDKVRFRGETYTIKDFKNYGQGSCGTWQIDFEEDTVHTDETPCEISVDLVYEDRGL